MLGESNVTILLLTPWFFNNERLETQNIAGYFEVLPSL